MVVMPNPTSLTSLDSQRDRETWKLGLESLMSEADTLTPLSACQRPHLCQMAECAECVLWVFVYVVCFVYIVCCVCGMCIYACVVFDMVCVLG